MFCALFYVDYEKLNIIRRAILLELIAARID